MFFQIALYLWINKGNDYKDLYETITHARIVYELYNRISGQSEIDMYQVWMAICKSVIQREFDVTLSVTEHILKFANWCQICKNYSLYVKSGVYNIQILCGPRGSKYIFTVVGVEITLITKGPPAQIFFGVACFLACLSISTITLTFGLKVKIGEHSFVVTYFTIYQKYVGDIN